MEYTPISHVTLDQSAIGCHPLTDGHDLGESCYIYDADRVPLVLGAELGSVDENAIVAIRPKPAFRPLFEIATTRAGSGVVLINQTLQTQDEPRASESCSWWRRGRG